MKVVDVEAELFRLIPSRFPPVQVFEGLVANDRLEALAKVESRTNPRLISNDHLRATISPTAHRLQNFNHAPFKYINPEGSRFFPPFPPVVEMADCRQTALAAAVARRAHFLGQTSEAPTGLDMRMLKTPVRARLADFTDVSPTASRDECRERARALPENVDGIVYRSPDRPSNLSYAILNGEVLGYTLQTAHFRFWWDGRRIAGIYAFENAQHLDPEQLVRPDEVLAA